MPSETSLKLLIALNAVQIFITILLVATMASTGINARSNQSGYGKMAVADPAADPGASTALHSTYANSAPAAGSNEIGGPETEPEAPAPAEASARKSSNRTQVILRTYLNLVSRRLKLAAEDSQMDASAYLPSEADLNLAVESQDVGSTEFTTVTDKLKEGYGKLGLEFPAPPQSKSADGGQ